MDPNILVNTVTIYQLIKGIVTGNVLHAILHDCMLFKYLRSFNTGTRHFVSERSARLPECQKLKM